MSLMNGQGKGGSMTVPGETVPGLENKKKWSFPT
jgi:hypothetical protein